MRVQPIDALQVGLNGTLEINPRLQVRRNYHELSYSQKGDPSKVLQYKSLDLDPDFEFQSSMDRRLSQDMNSVNHNKHSSWVRVAFRYSPINPADLNAVEGRYPSPFGSKKKTQILKNLDASHHDSHDTIPGSEVIGTVTHTFPTEDSNLNQELKVGDVVIPVYPGMGTWRSSIVLPSEYFLPLSSKLSHDPLLLSTINTNPCTAYRLLRDFLPSVPKHSTKIIQNGGASSVGIALSQLSYHLYKIPCISIVRQGSRTDSQFQDLVDYMINIGKNALVLKEEALIQGGREEIQKALRQIENLDVNSRSDTFLEKENEYIEEGDFPTRPILGYNCIGGESLSIMLRLLMPQSTVVTYGGMSKRPVTIPTGKLIFDQLQFCGYWHSSWLVQHAKSHQRIQMMNDILDLVQSEHLILGEKRVFSLQEYQKALAWNALSGGDQNHHSIKPKTVLDCSESCF